MLKKKNAGGVAPGSPEGARSATGGEPGAAVEVRRWSAGRKKEVVLRLLRGEPVDAISREVSVPIFKLERDSHRSGSGAGAPAQGTQTKNCVSRASFLGLAFKLVQQAQKSWRRVQGAERIADLLKGTVFKDGVPAPDDVSQQQKMAA